MNNASMSLFTNNVCNDCVPNILSFAGIFIGFILVGYWIYKLVTYDWSKFDEDSKDDDFLKPYE